MSGQRVGHSNPMVIETTNEYENQNQFENIQHVHDDIISSQSTQHYPHSHMVAGTLPTAGLLHTSNNQTSHPDILPGTISQSRTSGTAYVPYHHSNPSSYPDEGSFTVMPSIQTRQTQSQPQSQSVKHQVPEGIHSLSVGAPVGLGSIQMDYYQQRANSIEVPPNVSLSNASHQTHLRNFGTGEVTPSGTHIISHPMHSLMHHQISSPSQTTEVLTHNHPLPLPLSSTTGMQLLQGQDGASVPVDTSGMIKIKRWKIFPGRNRFFCDGRFVMAKEPAVFAFTIILLCGTFASFVYFE